MITYLDNNERRVATDGNRPAMFSDITLITGWRVHLRSGAVPSRVTNWRAMFRISIQIYRVCIYSFSMLGYSGVFSCFHYAQWLVCTRLHISFRESERAEDRVPARDSGSEVVPD